MWKDHPKVSLGRQLLTQLEDRFAEESRSMTYSEWVCTNTTLRKRPFSLKGYEFQRQILDDMHPSMDVLKASQLGMTEIELRKALAFCRRNQGVTAIFTLPDENMYKRVSQTRLKPILDEDRVFAPVGKGVKNVSVIQVHRSFLIVAAATEQFATGQPADAVFNDEVDLSDQQWLALFRSRMQNSNFRINQRFSTPTHMNYGIHENFLGTDQHQYLVRCDACNKHQAPEFSWDWIEIPDLAPKFREGLETPIDLEEAHLEGIDLRQSYVKCVRCGRALNMDEPGLREWVAAYPESKNRRGYEASPFVTSRLPPSYILGELFEYKRKSTVSLKGFYNTVLGKPFTGGHQRLSLESILACFEPAHVKGPTSDASQVVIGIDVGQTCHIVLGRPDGSLAFGFKAVPVDRLMDTLKELDETYNIVAGVIDRHPYEPTAREVYRWSEGRILPVEYRGRLEFALVKDKFDEISHGQADRTQLIDNVAQSVRKRVIRFAEYGIHKETICDHLQDMIRNDDDPEKDAVWIKVKGNDHFFHALALMLGAPKFRQLVMEQNKEEPRTELGGVTVAMDMGRMPSIAPQGRRNGIGFGALW